MASLDDVVQSLVTQVATDHGSHTPAVLTEYVLIASAQGFAPDGSARSQTFIFPGTALEHRVLGLVEYARLRLRANLLDAADADGT